MRTMARCAILAAILAAAAVHAESPARIVVLVSAEGPAYEQALRGLEAHFDQARLPADLDVEKVQGDGSALDRLVAEIASSPPDLVIALGQMAAARVLEDGPGIPVVGGLLLDSRLLESRENATGIFLEFPVRVQLGWLRKFFPNARSVGVLFHPETNGERILQARDAAKELGFELVAREVGSPLDLPDGLRSLANRVDVLWGIVDPVVLSAATAKSVLSFSYAHRIPFTGLSESWVKAGAVYALERDYEDIGRQCAEAAVRILSGEDVASIRPEGPRRVSYAVNLQAARHMKLELADLLVRGADRVFE
jgi:putative ABC transport system substrate-binding protein